MRCCTGSATGTPKGGRRAAKPSATHRFASLLLPAVIACSGAGAGRLVYERTQVAYRAGSYDPVGLTKVVVLPLVSVELENVLGIGPYREWKTRAQEHLLGALLKEQLAAEPMT